MAKLVLEGWSTLSAERGLGGLKQENKGSPDRLIGILLNTLASKYKHFHDKMYFKYTYLIYSNSSNKMFNKSAH